MIPVVVIDEKTIEAVYTQNGEEGFERWWTALGSVVRQAALAKHPRSEARRTARAETAPTPEAE